MQAQSEYEQEWNFKPTRTLPEALDTAAGAATCIICYLADHIETLRRWHSEQSLKQ